MLFVPIAPTTQIALNTDRETVTIVHIFPLSLDVANVVSSFANKAQGLVITRVTLPTVDLLALASLINEHVPRSERYGPRGPFQQTGVTMDIDLLKCTLGLMRGLTADERHGTDEVRTFTHAVREDCQIVAFVVTFARAHDIAVTIDMVAPKILQTLAEQLPDVQPG